jgi:hypothetical protein
MADVLMGLALWFVASVVLGIVIGRLIAAHERSSASTWAADRKSPGVTRAA